MIPYGIKDLCTSLAEMGFQVIYIPEFEMYIYPKEVVEFDPSSNRYCCQIKGKDITTRIDHFKMNLQNKNAIQTVLNDDTDVITYKWSYNIHYMVFRK